MDCSEPSRLRRLLRGINLRGLPNAHILSIMYLYSHSHSIVRSKEVLLYRAGPKLKHDLTSIERLYRYSCLQIFKFCDTAHNSIWMEGTILILLLVFDELRLAERSKEMDPPLVKHLQSVILSRLVVYFTRSFESDRFKKLRLPPSRALVLKCLSHFFRVTTLWPLCRQKELGKCWFKWGDAVHPRLNADRLLFPSCLLGRSIIKAKQTDCCCGWAFESIPSWILNFFDYSSDSFARHYHAKASSISFAGGEEDLDPRAIMNFRKPRLQNEIVDFRAILFFVLRMSFYRIRWYGTASIVNLTEGQLDVQANEHHQLLFSTILNKAPRLYVEFEVSRGEDYLKGRSAHELMSDFHSWRKDCRKKERVSRHHRKMVQIK